MTCSLCPRDTAQAGEWEEKVFGYVVSFCFDPLVPYTFLLKCSELLREWIVRRMARVGTQGKLSLGAGLKYLRRLYRAASAFLLLKDEAAGLSAGDGQTCCAQLSESTNYWPKCSFLEKKGLPKAIFAFPSVTHRAF